MRHLLNDVCHVLFVFVVLWIVMFRWWGAIVTGLLIGVLVELKEEGSTIKLKSFKKVNVRDVVGYMIGGSILSFLSR